MSRAAKIPEGQSIPESHFRFLTNLSQWFNTCLHRDVPCDFGDEAFMRADSSWSPHFQGLDISAPGRWTPARCVIGCGLESTCTPYTIKNGEMVRAVRAQRNYLESLPRGVQPE